MKRKTIQLWLHNHYEPIRFWLAMFMSFAVAVALITFGQRLLKLNETIKDNSDKNSQYIECIAKVLITPREPMKAIQGDISDPKKALENCKIAAGVSTQAALPVTTNVATQPGPAPSVSQNPNPTQNQNSSGGQGASKTPAETPRTSQPPPPQSILPGDQPPVLACIPILGVCI